MLKTKKEIIDWLDKYFIKNYIINEDLTVDINGCISFANRDLTSIEVQFRNVTENFSCACNNLTSLKGCPINVGGNFECNNNNLESLEFCPKKVGWNFCCVNNRLKNLEFCPEKIGNSFYCGDNKLTSLEFLPKSVELAFNCKPNENLGDLQFIYNLNKMKKILEVRKIKENLDQSLNLDYKVNKKSLKI